MTVAPGAVAAWEIPLLGDPADLEVLTVALALRAIRVSRREDGFLLSIPVAAVGVEYGPVRDFAAEHLAGINGVGTLLDSAFRPVQLTSHMFGVDAAGTRIHTVVAPEGLDLRMRLGTVGVLINGIRQPDPREVGARAMLDGAAKSQLAWDALAMVGRESPTWSELYLTYELVRSGTGGKVVEACGVTTAEISLFTHTANSYSALGREGRHGTPNTAPPAAPMSLQTAILFVRRLVETWLRQLAG